MCTVNEKLICTVVQFDNSAYQNNCKINMYQKSVPRSCRDFQIGVRLKNLQYFGF